MSLVFKNISLLLWATSLTCLAFGETTHPTQGEAIEEVIEVFDASENPSLIRACVEEICPNPKISYQYIANDILYEDEFSLTKKETKFLESIKLLINEIAALESQNRLDENLALVQWLAQPQTLKSSNLIRSLKTIELIGDLGKLKLDKNNSFSNEDNLKVFSELYPDETTVEHQERINILAQFKTMQSIIPLQVPTRIQTSEELLQSYAHRGHFDARFGVQVSNILDLRKHLQQLPEVGFYFAQKGYHLTSSWSPLLNSFSDNVNMAMMAEADMDFRNLSTWKDLSAPESWRNIQLPTTFSFSDFDKKENLTDRLIARNQILGKTIEQAIYRDYQSDACDHSVRSGLLFLPSKSDRKNYTGTRNRYIRNRRNQFFKNLKGKISEKSLSDMEKKGGGISRPGTEWTPTLPTTKESFQNHALSSLKALKKRTQQIGQDLHKTLKSKNKDAFLAMNAVFAATETEPYDNFREPIDSISHLCQDLRPLLSTDSFVHSTGRYAISPSSIKLPNHGHLVEMHELSHAASAFLSKPKVASPSSRGKYAKVKQCLSENHNNTGLQYAEEDFADLLPILNSQTSENMACPFARLTNQNEAYEDSSLISLNPDATHSSELFRLLHIEFLRKGRLPQNCIDGLKAKGQIPKFKKCQF